MTRASSTRVDGVDDVGQAGYFPGWRQSHSHQIYPPEEVGKVWFLGEEGFRRQEQPTDLGGGN